jgi:hypothetical protein
MILSIVFLLCYATCCWSTPQYQLPFNAQVPDVAFVNKLYSFTLSPSTFLSSAGPISYSIHNAPSWLQFNADNLTLFGTPAASDIGNPVFQLVATDSAGSATKDITLVVDNASRIQIADKSLTFQKPGNSCGGDCVSFPPQTLFSIQFSIHTFVATEGEPLFNYATLSDHVPLPAWMDFDPLNMTFSGITPSVGNTSVILGVDLIGSDVAGFGVERVKFVFTVSQHQLAFNQSVMKVDISTGQAVNITNLLSALSLDGTPVSADDIQTVKADTPDWLILNSTTLGLYGTLLSLYFMDNVTIWVEDKYGDVAEVEIELNLGYTQLYTGHIGTLNATAGNTFFYQLDKSRLLESNLTILADLGAAGQWLFFDTKTLSIQGAIPNNVPNQLIPANITFVVPNGTLWDAQDFYIQIGTSLLMLLSSLTPSGSGTSTGNGNKTSRLSTSQQAGIIAGCVIGGLFLLLITTVGFCVIFSNGRSKRRENAEARRGSSFKRIISKPFPQRTADQEGWAIGTYTDPELGSEAFPETGGHDPDRIEPLSTPGGWNGAPKVELDLGTRGSLANGEVLDKGSFMHRLISRHSLLAGNRRSKVDENHEESVTRDLLRVARFREQMAAVPGLEHPVTGEEEIERLDMNDCSSSVYSVEDAKKAHLEAVSQHPFDGLAILSPLPGIGHGMPPNHGWPRSSIAVSSMRSQSGGSPFDGIMYNDAEGNAHYFRRSFISQQTRPFSRTSSGMTGISRRFGSRRSKSSDIISRPVPRRNPYHSTFFAGGGVAQLKGSVASRRFAEHGLGLSIINDSSVLEARDETESELGGNPVMYTPSHLHALAHKRSQSDWTWSIRESDAGSTSWQTLPATVHDENCSVTGLGVSIDTSFRQDNDGLSIMERGRAAYRRNESRERLPLQSIGVNNRLGSAKVTKNKGKGRLLQKGKMLMRGSKEMRLASVQVDPTRFKSLEGEEVNAAGNEAFI